MSITDRTRRILWTRAGNRCAICRARLVRDSNAPDEPESVVGDECHIVARRPGGPRAGEISAELIDSYDNLILLCKVDHKRVDDNPSHHTSERLRRIKQEHEKWIDSSLEPRPTLRWTRPKGVVTLNLIATGRELLALNAHACAVHFEHVEPSSAEEAELIGDFEQEVQDYGDIWSDIGAGQRVKEEFSMTERINELAESGLLVYAGRYVSTLHGPQGEAPWPVAVFKIDRFPQEIRSAGEHAAE